MKKVNRLWLLPLLATLLVGCANSYDEFYFKGTSIGMELCSGTSAAFLIAVDQPKNIGDTLTINGKHYDNVVMGYRASRLLSNGETVYGVAYQVSDYAALNCMSVYYVDIPEVILVSVDEDSLRVQELL